MRFSLIIVTYNGLHHLQPCLDTLLPQLNADWEAIIVDNNSSDGTEQYMQKLEHPCIRYLRLERNCGFAEGNNTGVRQAQGEYIFLVNNDTLCDANLLSILQDASARFPEYELFACKMIRFSDGKIDNKGFRMDRLLRARQIDTGQEVRREPVSEVFGASGGATMIRRSVIDDIGLFDPIFFAYQEDVDFAVRARLAGYRCLYLPDAIVHHKGGGTSSFNASLYRYYNQRNMVLVVLRNLPISIILKFGIGHVAYSFHQILKWTMRGDGFSVFKSKTDAFVVWRSQNRYRFSKARVNCGVFGRFLVDDFGRPTPGTDSKID